MNKKLTLTITLLSLLCNHAAYADEEEAVVEQTEQPLQEIGMQDAPIPKSNEDNNLKNWLFAAGSVISATVAILVVSFSPGTAPNNP